MIRKHGRTLVRVVMAALLCVAAGFIHADPPVPTMVLSLPDAFATSGSSFMREAMYWNDCVPSSSPDMCQTPSTS